MNKTIQEQINKGTAYEDACGILGVQPLTRESYNHLPEAEGDYDWAEHKIKRVADAMNKIDNFKPDYRNRSQAKWFPLFWFSGSGWSLYDSCASRTALTIMRASAPACVSAPPEHLTISRS